MSIFKSTFKPYVSNQINARQDLVNYSQTNRPIEFNLYTSGKAAWSRMVSLVDYNSPDGKYKGQDLSRKYILQGGTLYNKTNSNNPTLDEYILRSGVAYKDGAYGGNIGNRDYGLRPMPGISQINLKSKTAYGSLREATVEFYAWDKKQLDELEILFMRTGYWVLIEWGWSMYLDTSKYSKVSQLVGKGLKQFDQPTINPFQESINQEAIYEQLEKLKEKFCGNYDGILGLVRNFSWSMLPNGGFKCIITVISVGEVIDSIKVNSGNSEKLFNDNQTPVKTYFELFLDKLIKHEEDEIFGDVIPDIVDVPDIRRSILTIPFEKSKKTGGIHYIQFGYFIALLNKRVNFFSKEKTLFKLEIPLTKPGNLGNAYCLASVDTVSIDPEVCIIRNTKAKFICDNLDGFNLAKGTRGDTDDYIPDYIRDGYGIIGNIFISIEYAKVVYLQMLSDTKGEVHLAKYIKNILSGISEALGGINDFDIFVNDNKSVIIDKHYCESDSDSAYKGKFKLNILGTNSVVRGAKIESKIFSSQSTMVAIAAGDRENLGSIQSSTNVAMNKGLTSRVFQNFSESEKDAAIYDTKNEEIEKAKFIDAIIDLRSYVTEYILKRKLPDDNNIKSSAGSLLKTLILRVNNDTNYKAIIPIILEFKLDGVSGITIGEIFTINADILPKEYQDKRIGFIVTGLGASLTRNDWTTDITAMVCLLDQVELKKNKININALKYDFKAALNQKQTVDIIKGRESIVNYNILVAILSDYYSSKFMRIRTSKEIRVNKPITSLIPTNAAGNGTLLPFDQGQVNLILPSNAPQSKGLPLSVPSVNTNPLVDISKTFPIDPSIDLRKRLDIVTLFIYKIKDKKMSAIYTIGSVVGSNYPTFQDIADELNNGITDIFNTQIAIPWQRLYDSPYNTFEKIFVNKERVQLPYFRNTEIDYNFISSVIKSSKYYNALIPEFKNQFDTIFDNTFKAAALKKEIDFDFKAFTNEACNDYGRINLDKYYNIKITNKKEKIEDKRDLNLRFSF